MKQESEKTCPQDVKECLGGKVVSRDPDNGCEFPPCPKAPQAFCTREIRQCPGGGEVGRDPENACEFYPCPAISAGTTTEPISVKEPQPAPKAAVVDITAQTTTAAQAAEVVSFAPAPSPGMVAGEDDSGFWSLGKLSILVLIALSIVYFCYRRLCIAKGDPYYTPKAPRGGIEMRNTGIGRSAYVAPTYLPAE